MNYELLGKNLARARLEQSITQEALAERVNLSAVFISQIENATRKPSLETMFKLSAELEISMDALLGLHVEKSRCGELIRLMEGRSDKEIALATRVVRALLRGVEGDRLL